MKPTTPHCTLWSLFAAGLLLASAGPARATAHLVKELNTKGASTSPTLVGKAGGRAIFVALDAAGAYSLWATDGSQAGSERLAARIAIPSGGGMRFTDVAGTLYFLNLVDDIVELWRTDGTEAGTGYVATPPNEAGASPTVRSMANVGGKLFFEPYHAGTGYTLWASDGTEAGTALVADIRTGSGTGSGEAIVGFNGVAFFQATDASGTELWSSDGTEAGTARVKDINPGAGSSYPGGFAVMNGLLYFSANDGTTGAEMWVTDGTEAGTTRVTDRNPGSGDFGPGSLTVLGNKLIFVGVTPGGGNEMWSSDGTDAGTISLGGNYPLDVSAAGGYVYYRDYDSGNQLWRTDGTPAGTIYLAAVDPTPVTSFEGIAYFEGYQSGTGEELWRSDGTPGGTYVVKDIVPGPFDSSPAGLLDLDGTLLFSASAADGQRELWTSNGSSAGTHVAVDLTPPPSASSFLSQLTATGGRLAFVRDDYSGPSEVWLSDGTSGGTAKINTGTVVAYSIGDWNGKLLLQGYDDLTNDSGLWVRATNGSLQLLYPDNTGSPVGIGSSLFFNSADKALVSHGVPGDAVELVSIPGPVGCSLHGCVEFFSYPRSFVDIGGGTTLFLAFGTGGGALWRTDGTPEGTSAIGSVGLPYYESPLIGKAMGGKLYYSSSDTNGFELWTSDGTIGGTGKVLEINPGAASSTPDEFTVFAGRMFFVATDPAGGRELWSSDGSEGGTARVADISPGATGSDPAGLRVVNGLLVFAATGPTDGRELWASDGTEIGTVQIKDIRSGARGSDPSGLETAGGKVYFRADDGVHGSELWSTDGTTGGTILSADMEPGAGGSTPSELKSTGNNLFFLTSTSIHGTELWAGTTLLLCGNDQLDPGETCDDGNRDDGDGCDAMCVLESCGDAIPDPGEQCDDGNTEDGDGCSRGCLLDCPAVPESSCRTTIAPRSARFLLKADPRPDRGRISWNWKNGEMTPKTAFGDPLGDTGYELCVYDNSGLAYSVNAAAGGTCGNRPCWSEQAAGFKYKGSRPDGSFQLGLKAGQADGDTRITIKLKGSLVTLSDPLAILAPMTVQLRNGSACWEETFSAPFASQTTKQLKADSD